MRTALAAFMLLGAPSLASAGAISSIDLAREFGTRSPWTFSATQGAEIEDPIGLGTGKAPGAITICITRDGGRSCRPDLRQPPRFPDDLFAEPHYLNDARIVRPAAARPLLLVQVSSLHSANGDQLTTTRLLAYDRTRDVFTPVFEQSTGRNNNQQVRYVESGPLKGAVIAAEPTADSPFGYWVVVSKLSGGRYAQVLRFRSATRYGDGNPLPVIDSEMPNIQQRLGLWRAGQPLPLPAGRVCPKPRLVLGALWCK